MELLAGIISTFKKKSSKLLIENSGWGDEVQRSVDTISTQLRRRIKEKRAEEIKKLHSMYCDAVKETIKTDVSSAITELNPDFWNKINLALKSEFGAIVMELEEILKEGYDASQNEFNDFIENFKNSTRKAISEYITERIKNLNDDVLRKFKKTFERDEKGVVRDWVAMEVQAIRELWAQCYTDLHNIFDKFRSIEIDFDELIGTPGTTPDKDDEPPLMKRKSSVLKMRDRLMSEVEINKCKDRFREEAERVQEDAIRLHSNSSSGGIPWWFLALFAWFAIDDVWRMIMSPFLFYPIMLVASVGALLYSMGLGPIVMPMVQTQFNMYSRKLGLGFGL